jgi:hypothetical protein
MFDFIEQLAPHLDPEFVRHVMSIADPEERSEFCSRLDVPRI